MKLTEKKINMKRYRNYYHVTPEKSFSHSPISSFYKNTFLPLQKWISLSVCRHSLYSPDCSLQVCWWLAVMYWCESEKWGVSKRGFIFWSGHPYVEIGRLLWMSCPSDQLMRVYVWQKFLRQGLLGFVLYFPVWCRGWLVTILGVGRSPPQRLRVLLCLGMDFQRTTSPSPVGNKELSHLLKSYSQAKNQLIQKKWHDMSISDEAGNSNLSSFTAG